MKTILALIAVVAAGLVAWYLWGRTNGADMADGGAAIVDIALPKALSAQAMDGKAVFDANCSACHGANAAGKQGFGPPLVHIIYEPSHHGDAAFHRAAALGVRQHHWKFGNMPPVETVGPDDINRIIAYIREMQRANGIN